MSEINSKDYVIPLIDDESQVVLRILVEEIDRRHKLKAGTTALYWCLINAINHHVIPDVVTSLPKPHA